MDRNDPCYQGYILAVGSGAVGGSFLMALATKAIPKMMTVMMSTMMETMISQMGAGECDPAEI